jgi:hypothetical protein
MADYTNAFQGRILLVNETVYGVTETNPEYLLFSDYVQNVAPTGDPQRQDLRGFDSYDVKDFANGIQKYGLTVEFLVQRDTEIQDFINRQASGRLKSWQLEISINQDGVTKAFYTLSGVKPNSIDLSTEEGDVPLLCKVEFMVKNVVIVAAEPSIGTGSREASIGDPVYTYVGGDLERPSSTSFAYMTRTISLSVAHNLTPLPDIGETGYMNFSEGIREITGSADIAVEDGGKVQFDEAITGTENDMLLYFGIETGDPILTISDVQFPDANFEFNKDDGAIFFSRPYVGKSASFSTVP